MAPRDFIELHIAVDALDSVTTRNEQFVLLSDIASHTVVFTCDSNLQILCGPDAERLNVALIYMNNYYIILACINGHYLPLVYCLLSGKSEDLYTLVWMSIRNRCTTLGLTFQPSMC